MFHLSIAGFYNDDNAVKAVKMRRRRKQKRKEEEEVISMYRDDIHMYPWARVMEIR